MWELCAVWRWIPAFLAAFLAVTNDPLATPQAAAFVALGTIAIGGGGALVAGVGSDRFGRITVTSVSMVVSGAASLLAGFVFGASLSVVVPFVLVWGFAVVADSAQFSAAVTELAEGSYVGSALTLQTTL